MTPTFARMVAARANALRKPVRWFSVPQLFRYERQQKGRLREHFQLNVDIVGESAVTADAELLSIALDIMRELGFTSAGVKARVSDRRLLQALLTHAGASEDAMPAVFAVIDKLGREPAALSREKLDSIVGADVSGRIDSFLALENIDVLSSAYENIPEVAEHVERMRKYFEYLHALGFADWVTLDLSIVRGLAYYTGIVFELFDTAGEYRAICGGGRYDTLLDTLGGVDLPALGFGMGDVVVGELLRSRALIPATAPRTDYWVAGEDESLISTVMSIATQLRGRDKSVEYALKPQQLSRQLRSAVAAGASHAILLKHAQLDAGEVTVRDLAEGTERSVRLTELINSL